MLKFKQLVLIVFATFGFCLDIYPTYTHAQRYTCGSSSGLNYTPTCNACITFVLESNIPELQFSSASKFNQFQ